MIYKLGNLVPKIGENNLILESASIIGEVETGKNVSIWFSAVLRADMSKIVIGNNSNIQDNTTVHGDTPYPVVIGENVTIGHNCVIHGCEIGDNVIVGMGSILLNGAKIPKNCIVGAGSLVTDKLVAEEGDLIVGSPAKVIKKLSEKNIDYLKYANKVYLDKIETYKKLERIG
ncbi:gamma carbonic anhydrase family protein [Candidatus Cetobacterium colombiensis]|jgi:carbonic anhydrase/acetyltransferase-like protein (isoleucine patch superfamily)|uniref:Gamma carbonic anhydrase family protein n=1 Tax=Candidatus Cetobacterium colombiensis TaxID=3073100 RepID=A0ABU4W754_9FUSO|nr:gamma carbonic anhydrase family protein [Candidatus Cetobacterium colombiensis]MDX8335356.1 gamma carbonic anhydrase family protein [Candidatus Cetobacterium colombiensis]